jgi:tetratricopeptide (TPR) repeat protein
VPRTIISLLLILVLAACASPGNPVTARQEGDVHLDRADQAMATGDFDDASEMYARAFECFRACEAMARQRDVAGRRVRPDARQCAEEARYAIPIAAMGAASAHYEIALGHWRSGDDEFGRGNFGDAQDHYDEAFQAYQAEERWLRVARARLENLPSLEAEREEVESDLAHVREEQKLVRENLDAAFTLYQENSTAWGAAIGDGLMIGLEAVGEFALNVTIYVLLHPVFWECVGEVIIHLCRRR